MAQVREIDPVVIEATDQNFVETVVEESKKRPVVVDLWASWCGPCRTLGLILEKVAGERNGAFLLAKLDVDANPYTAGQFGVQSIPTVVAFRDGQPIDGFVVDPELMVNEFVDRLMPTEAELEAEDALEEELEGHYDAEQKYRDALEVDPNNRDARVGLGRILAETGREAEAREGSSRRRCRTRRRSGNSSRCSRSGSGPTRPSPGRSHPRSAWRRKAGGARPSTGMLGALSDDPDARQAMLEVFTVLGDDDELVAEYRRKLAAALF